MFRRAGLGPLTRHSSCSTTPATHARRTGFARGSVRVVITGAVTAGLLAVGMTAPAQAAEEPVVMAAGPDGLDAVAELADTSALAAARLDDLIPATAETVDGIASSGSVVTSLPSEQDPTLTSVELGTGQSIAVGVPGAEVVSDEGGAVRLDSAQDGSYVVHATDDGGIQVVNIAQTPTAEHSFAIRTEVPVGASWQTTASGSLELVDATGAALAAVDVPWALDANGVSLPTHFTVAGGLITQHVDTSAAAFPVVSDPSLWWIIGSSAVCAAEIAGLVASAAGIVAKFAKADKIIKSAKAVASAYKALGGTVEKVVDILKKYVKNKASLTKGQIKALEDFIDKVGSAVFNLIGLGTCYALVSS